MISKDISTSESTQEASNYRPKDISDNALVVLEKRYLLRSSSGEITETPNELFRRVAKAIAKPDALYGEVDGDISQTEEDFYRVMANLEFLPNSPTMMNAGTGAGTLSACFVLPLTDSMEGIMKAAHDAAMVQKYGGGTGFSLSEIRRKGAPISSTHGKACGPIAVLRLLSSVSTLVTQGGKRDGANMAVMNVHHPDILEFIDCKAEEGEIHNFNISVGATDEFMEAVKAGKDYPLLDKRNPADDNSDFIEVGRLDAREVMGKIIYGAWRNGEPGMIFLDTVNRDSPVEHVGTITATNPCGEQPLLPNESCNLGSIDLGKFVKIEDASPEIEWERLGKFIRLAIHFLDNVIDANKYAVPEIDYMTKHTRKLGLGVMGFADMLIKLGIPYDSEEGVELGRKIMLFFKNEADEESMKLAEKRGNFPAWEGSSFQKQGAKFRNACRLTVAPTGTISMIAGASSGIEPIFSLAYRKQNILGGKTLYYVNKNFESAAHEYGFYSDELMEYLANGGSLQTRDDVPADVRRLFKVSADISPKYHVLMQAAFQESTDAGISKTINFRNEATIEDVQEAYITAWETKCKGITVYRAGSRYKEVLTSGHKDNKGEEVESQNGRGGQKVPQYAIPEARPVELNGFTRRVKTGRGNLYVTINTAINGRPFEVFAAHGKAGGNDAAMAEALSRTISLSLRSGIDPRDIVHQLKDITDTPAWDNGHIILSVPDAIAKVLAGDLKDSTEQETAQSHMFKPNTQEELGLLSSRVLDKKTLEMLTADNCPECYAMLAHEENCAKCYSCGYSKC